jgi:hypothetical protein
VLAVERQKRLRRLRLAVFRSERKKITIQHDGDARPSRASLVRPRRNSGAGAICRFRKSSRAKSKSTTTNTALTNGKCRWPPRFCAASSVWPDIFCPRRSKFSFLSPPTSPADFIRRRKFGNACKNARLTCIFSCSPSPSARPASARGRRRDAAVFVFAVRRAGTLRVGPHAKRNPLAVPRRAENRHGRGRTKSRTRSAVENLRAGMKLLIKPGAQFPVDGGNRQGRDRRRRIEPHRRSHARGKNCRRHRARRNHQSLGRGRSARHETRRRKFAAKNHHAHPRGAAAKSARAAVHRQIQHHLHLFRAGHFRS